ncbi:MAG: GH92 family glycosyl hydrolase [Phycisphaerae bacterium]|jgi:predicted alpha-1,2-mannosidase
MQSKKIFLGVLASAILAASALSQPTDYVDPFIGTGGHGHTSPSATVPFGMIQAGPANFFKGWDWCSGYHISDMVIRGFTHTHLSGTGCSDLGDVLMIPYTGRVRTYSGTEQDPDIGYACRIDHKQEEARPGYYRVFLRDYNVNAEMTSSEHSSMHRYTYPRDEVARVTIDLQAGNGDGARKTQLIKVDENTFTGYRFSSGWASDSRIFFAVKTSVPVSQFQLYQGDDERPGNSHESDMTKGVLTFGKVNKPVLVKIALSPVSMDNALANMEAEMSGWDFDGVAALALAKWNKELGSIEIEASEKIKRIFYTAQYHTMLAPVLFSDVNKDYRGTDKKVYEKADFTNYTTFSLWDTYRTEHPLLTITQPGRVNDMINSMLAIYQQQGTLPIWHLFGCETGCMVGWHSIPVIVDAYLKGFDGFDAELAFEAIKKSSMVDDRGGNYLKSRGYIPGDKEHESVAKALEYAIDDSCTALMAKAMGKQADYEYFYNRSKAYRRYFDKETEFMRGVMDDGSWRTPFDAIASRHRADDYCEGNAWHYTWLVPHDPEGLVDLFGSEKAYNDKLDALFNMSSDLGDGASADISGLIGMYAHGNEPSHHTTYMYCFSGQQWKTAQRVRQVLSTLYFDDYNGLSGNEDCGQMSAWYVMNSLGFYPVHPANGLYVFGSPAVDKAVINLASGKTFTITAVNNSDENIYIQSAKLNGEPYSKGYISYKQIMAGGELEFQMGPASNRNFATSPEDRAKSEI